MFKEHVNHMIQIGFSCLIAAFSGFDNGFKQLCA